MDKGYADSCTDLDLLAFGAEYRESEPEPKPDQAEAENRTDESFFTSSKEH